MTFLKISLRKAFLALSLVLGMLSLLPAQAALSLKEQHQELDDFAVMTWYMKRKPMMTSLYEQNYKASGGAIYSNGSGFFACAKAKDGLQKVRPTYYGDADLSTASLEMLDRAPSVTVGGLRAVLGIEPADYKSFMQKVGIQEDEPAFPSNVVQGYRWISCNPLMRQLLLSYSKPEESIWSITGGPVAALGGLKVLIESWHLNRGGMPVNFHINLMGELPEYSWRFLASCKMGRKIRQIRPTADGKWLPSLRRMLSPDSLEMYERTAKAVGGYN